MSPDLTPLELERKRQQDRHIRRQFRVLMDLLKGLPSRRRARAQSRFAQRLIDQTYTVDTPLGPLSFVILGLAAAKRASSLLTKQPATIEWIHSFRPGSVFWDVGANIGVYALYAALRGDVQVVAFEPAAVNYFMLAANSEVNNFESRMECLLLGLGSERAIARLQVSQFASAHSFSFRGKTSQPRQGRQAALVLPVDQLVEEYGLACPNYMKVDVPGLTGSIIEGAERTLRRPELRELHIEMQENSNTGHRIRDVLTDSGFVIAMRHGRESGTTDLTFVRRDA